MVAASPLPAYGGAVNDTLWTLVLRGRLEVLAVAAFVCRVVRLGESMFDGL